MPYDTPGDTPKLHASARSVVQSGRTQEATSTFPEKCAPIRSFFLSLALSFLLFLSFSCYCVLFFFIDFVLLFLAFSCYALSLFHMHCFISLFVSFFLRRPFFLSGYVSSCSFLFVLVFFFFFYFYMPLASWQTRGALGLRLRHDCPDGRWDIFFKGHAV